MSLQTIPAVYESGVFKPLEPIRLKAHQKIRLIIETEDAVSFHLKGKDNAHTRMKKFISQKYGKEIVATSSQEAERLIDQLSAKVREGLAFTTLKDMEQFLRSNGLDLNR